MSLQPDFRIETVPAAGLIYMTFIGFWDDATADAFGAALDRALQALARAGARPGGYRYLADFRQSAIQSPVMVEKFQGFAATAGTLARRIVVLSPSMLQKMQTQRMAAGYDHYRFFLADQEAQARAALLED